MLLDISSLGGTGYFEVYHYSRDTIHHPLRQWQYDFFRTFNGDQEILREGLPIDHSYNFVFQTRPGDGENILEPRWPGCDGRAD